MIDNTFLKSIIDIAGDLPTSIDNTPSYSSIDAYLLGLLVCATAALLIFLVRTRLWINFASKNKFKSRLIFCLLLFGLIVVLKIFGNAVSSQIKGRLYTHADLIEKSILVGAYGATYNSQILNDIPKEQKSAYNQYIFGCLRAISSIEADELIASCQDITQCSLSIPPRSQEDILNKIKLLQAQNLNTDPQFALCNKIINP